MTASFLETHEAFDHVLSSHSGQQLSLPAGFKVALGGFEAAGPDLIIHGEAGQSLLVEGFYVQPPVGLISGPGQYSYDLIDKLAGSNTPGDYAQAALTSTVEPIGQVETLEGSVSAVRADGTSVVLNAGDPVFQGDVIRTASNGSVGITFKDDSAFSLDENGEMVLDEMVYDPDTGEGSFSSTLTSGVFSFVSGQIAKTNPDAMEITTPVATIGIRGTQGVIKQENGGPMQTALLQEPGGLTGELTLTNGKGSITLNQPGQYTAIISFTAEPGKPVNLNTVQIAGSFGTRTIQVLNSSRQSATQRRAEARQEEADNLRAEAEAAKEAAAQAEGAEAEALQAEAQALEAQAAEAEAQAEAAAAEAQLVAEAAQAYSEQMQELEQQINDFINSGLNDPASLLGQSDPQGQGNTDQPTPVPEPITINFNEILKNIIAQIGPVGFGNGDDDKPIKNVIEDERKEIENKIENELTDALGKIDYTHIGTSGNDSLTASTSLNDGIIGLGGDDYIDAGAGDDVIAGGSGIDTIYGRAGDDFIHGDNPDSGLEGFSYISSLFASDSGSDDRDIIYGGLGNDKIYGGGGNDDLYGEEGNDTIDGGDGADSLIGGLGNDILSGGAGNDIFSDNDGSDTIDGGAGDDIINAAYDPYSDVFSGGDGSDTLSYPTADGNLVITISGSDSGIITSNGVTDAFSGIEHLTATSSADTVNLVTTSPTLTIDGNSGTDILALTGSSYDFTGYTNGSSKIIHFETLDLSTNTTAVAIDANFVDATGIFNINGSSGDSINLNGGWVYTANSGGYNIFKTTGLDFTLNIKDTITTTNRYYNAVAGATTGANSLNGTTGRDVMWGNNGADIIYGGDGNDVIAGGGDGDTSIDGGAGDDVIFGDSPASTYTSYAKFLHYNFGDITSGATADGNDTINGGTGSDSIYGGGGDDVIKATLDGANDFFFGNNGTFDASTGVDTLTYADESSGITVSFTNPTKGVVTDGSASDSFDQIDNFIATANADTINHSAAIIGLIDAGDGNDTLNLSSFSTADTILGGNGNDTFNITSQVTVNNTLSGGSGDDTFNVTDLTNLSSSHLTGGSTGQTNGDMLTWQNSSLETHALSGLYIVDFEVFDITGASGGINNTFKIDQAGMSGNAVNTITVVGDAGDTVNFLTSDSWVAGANDGTYTSYTSSTYTVRVENELTVGTY